MSNPLNLDCPLGEAIFCNKIVYPPSTIKEVNEEMQNSVPFFDVILH